MFMTSKHLAPSPRRKQVPRLATEIGLRLQDARRTAKLSQAQLAKRLGISRISMSKLERGEQAVFVDHLYRAAQALGVEVGALLPSVSQILSAPPVHTPDDEPLSSGAARSFMKVAESIMRGTKVTGGTDA